MKIWHNWIILWIILWRFCNIFWIPKILSLKLFGNSRERTLICQFVINKHTSFHLWWKENLLNHKFSKQYEHDCLQNFILLFMSLLTDVIVRNSHILAWVYFIFLKKGPRPNMKGLEISEKIEKVVIK